MTASTPSPLQRINTHLAANAGLGAAGLGSVGILEATHRLFQSLSDPHYILALYLELHNHTFGEATSQLVALCFAIVGAVAISIVGAVFAYYGRPSTIPPSDAAQAASVHPNATP